MVDRPIELQTPTLNRQEHEALQMVNMGEADAYQQRLALKVIISKLSRAHDLSYINGDSDASAFLAGRGFVGKELLKYLKLPSSDSPEVDNNG